jgi:hypothetical protein
MSIQKEKAVIASMASFYHKQGKEDEAHLILKDSGNEEALADFLLTQGRHQEVVDLLQDRNDPVSRARYVQALPYVDPEKAHQVWASLGPLVLEDEDDASVNDGAQLELRELPRLKSSKSRAADTANTSTSTQKKSHEAVLQQRAWKREAYLAELERKGTYTSSNQKPDPERWLPK